MTNNEILRRVRYIFNFSDDDVLDLFAEGGLGLSLRNIDGFMRKEEDPELVRMSDKQLAYFLNGLIISKRGKQDGKTPMPESQLNNNIILRKFKIAFSLKDEDIVDFIKLAGKKVSKHEVNAFFRKPTQVQYRKCLDQFLRNFLSGLQLKHRPNE